MQFRGMPLVSHCRSLPARLKGEAGACDESIDDSIGPGSVFKWERNWMEMSTARQAARPEKIHALTSLRFFAALFVVCFHALWIFSFLPAVRHESAIGRLAGLG